MSWGSWVTVLLGVAATTVAWGAAAAAAGPATHGGPVLYLMPNVDGAPLPNFTATPPADEDPYRVMPGPIVTGSGEVVWKWVMNRAPERWDVPAGLEFTTTLHFLRLDRVVPVSDPVGHPKGLGQLHIQVDFIRLSSDASFATGTDSMLVDPVSAYTSAIDVTVTSTVTAPTVFAVVPGDAPLFGIKVTLTGQARNQDPPLLLVGATDAASHVRVPSFPIEAFAAWERHDEEQKRCNELTLQGEACDAHGLLVAPPGHATDAAPLSAVTTPPAWSLWAATSDGLALIGIGLSMIVAGVTKHVIDRRR